MRKHLISWRSDGPDTWRSTPLRDTGRDEKFLENLVAAQPSILGLESVRTGIRGPFVAFQSVQLETPVGRGVEADIVFLTASGHVIVVEVKLADNNEIKDKQVIGQVIEYAASLSQYLDADLVELFGGGAGAGTSWETLVGSLFPNTEDRGALAETLADRMRRAELHLVIVCDGAPEGVPDLMRAASRQAGLGDYELHFVEVTPFVRETGGTEVLFVPSTRFRTEIVGRTAITVAYEARSGDTPRPAPSISIETTSMDEMEENNERARQGSSRRKWGEASFFDALRATASDSTVRAVSELFTYVKENGSDLGWGTGVNRGSFSARVQGLGDQRSVTVYTNGVLQIQFQAMPRATAEELKRRITSMPGFRFNDGQGYPLIGPDIWVPKAAELLEVLRSMRDFCTPDTAGA